MDGKQLPDHIHTAAIMASFVRIVDTDQRKPGEKLQERLYTSYDRVLGALMNLSLAVGSIVDQAVDWERWEGGVFSYECLESDPASEDRTDLPSVLLSGPEKGLTDLELFYMAENLRLPREERLASLVCSWMVSRGLPVFAAWRDKILIQSPQQE